MILSHPVSDFVTIAAIVIPQLIMAGGAYIRMMQRLQSIEDRLSYLERYIHHGSR